jgi:hypothetical protein
MRTVILHYHLFKNAGTSLDAAFKDNFSEDEGEWVTKEFSNNPKENREGVTQWILENPDAKCFSSHTAFLTSINIEGIKIIPVIFIRNPIDRISSAYHFETKQNVDDWAAVLAKNTSFKGYVDTRLAMKWDRQCRNFHSFRFSTLYGSECGSEIERALLAIDSLPFVGIVENFSDSVNELELLLKSEGFDNIKLSPKELNVGRAPSLNIEKKLLEIKLKLGDGVYNKLTLANHDDFDLYALAVKKLEIV